MKFAIKHEIKGRIRIHLAQKHMTYRQADILQYYLEKQANISKASVYVRTQDVAVVYTGSRDGPPVFPSSKYVHHDKCISLISL